MKLVFQIAAGILLAGGITWGASVGVGIYLANKAQAELQQKLEQQRAEALRLQQEQARKNALLEQQRAEAARNKAEEQRVALELVQRKNLAFSKWYQAPSWCENAAGFQVLVRCADIKTNKRNEFDQLWAAGKLQ